MIKQSLFILFIHSIFGFHCQAQDAGTLNVGDNAPNLVLASTNNSIQSFSFPYQNKMVLLFFWSSSVSKSKENIYKYKKLYSKYSDIGFKTADGFDVISVALQSDKIAWTQDLVKYDMIKFNNCIAQKGYNDIFVKNYRIKETTTSFLIDEFGKIAAVNPDLKTLITYLDEKRNQELNPDPQTRIAGKIMFGQQPLTGLNNEHLWFINGTDTMQKLVLDEHGAFLLPNINSLASLKLYFRATPKVNDESTVFLTSESGDIISPFVRTENGFEYNLLEVEIPYLKPLSDFGSAKINSDKSVKNLNRTEQLFKSKSFVLTHESIGKLTKIVTILKENPKLQVEIISHTDSKDEATKNQLITQKQSGAVSAYLVAKGISKSRIKASGKGESDLLNKCSDGKNCSDDEHAQNQRTEFKFFLPQ